MTQPTARAHRRIRLLAAALGCLLAPGGPAVLSATASADKQITAVPQNRYQPSEVTMDQGERLTFRNNDTVRHDVSATDRGEDGRPLFRTPLLGPGEEAFVDGSQYLTTGAYEFVCTVHTGMRGRLNVSSAGTPAPRPAPGSPPPSAGDTTAPGVTLRVRTASVARARARRRISVEVSVTEAAEVTLTAAMRVRRRRTTIARGSISRSSLAGGGTQRPVMRLTRAGRKALKGRSRASLTVTARAEDAAGNTTTVTASRTLRR